MSCLTEWRNAKFQGVDVLSGDYNCFSGEYRYLAINDSNSYSVSQSFVESESEHRFNTIQSAIDFAYSEHGVITDLSVLVVIHVAPGKYIEQIHSYLGYHIVGEIANTYGGQKSVLLYNTGADADHYPLMSGAGYIYNMENFNIHVDAGGTIGAVPNGHFMSCTFRYGEFIERDISGNSYTQFDRCSFRWCDFNLAGVTPGGRRTIGINDSWLGDCDWTLSSTHDTSSAFWIDGCTFKRCDVDIDGDWKMQYLGSHMFGNDRITVDTTSSFTLINCVPSCGIHFISDPDATMIHGCNFNDAEGYTITDEDITADAEITNVNYIGNIQQNGISGKIHTTAETVSVGGNAMNRYYSIQDAIDSFNNGGIISVEPGKYTEQIHSRSEIVIQGRTHEGAPALKSTILYNTGVDAAHYPLRCYDDDKYTISDITIETDSGGTIGKFASCSFSGVVFHKGHFIEATVNKDLFLAMSGCSSKDSMVFNLTGAGSGGMRAVTIAGCYFGEHTTHCKFDSTHTDTLLVAKDTIFHRFYPDVGGNWKCEMSDCHTFGTSRSVVSTTSEITLIKCITSNGLHFTSNPDTIIQLCTFNDDCGYLISGADITSTVDVTDVDYVGNIQQNGLSGKIKIACPIKSVGCNSANKYYTLQDAIDSIVTKGTVSVSEDLTGLSELTMPNEANVTIDCHKTYSLAFTGDIVEIGNNRRCAFQNFVSLAGGEIRLNGTNAELAIEDCQYVTAHVIIDVGVFAIIYKSSLFGSTGNPAVTINSLTCPDIFGYSRIQGSTGNQAVKFNVDADDAFKAKYSTFIHGDGGTNEPITYAGVGKINIAIYACGLNALWNAADFTNTIGSAGNITDPSISF